MSIATEIERIKAAKENIINTLKSKGMLIEGTVTINELGVIIKDAPILDTSDATATTNDILKDKIAYVKGEKVIGTLEALGGGEWEEIFASSFDNTKGSKTTKLPEGITTINSYAFYGCTNLALKELPKTVKTIQQYAFNGCTNLELIELPSGLTTLDSYAFQRCSKLNINELPSGITEIKSYAFYACDALASLKILGNITNVGDRAFYSCDSLEKLILPNVTSVPTITAYTFYGTPIATGTGYIYVPDSLVDSFKSATNWSAYGDKIKGVSELA